MKRISGLLPVLLLGLMVVACAGEGTTPAGDGPSPSPPAQNTPALEIPTPPPMTPATPSPVPQDETPAPSPAALATATAPPPAATPTALPEATAEPTATPRPDLSFHFGADLTGFERTLIITAIEVTRDMLTEATGVRPPVAVFAYSSTVELAQNFAELAYAQNWRADGLGQRLFDGIAEASYRGVVINTGSSHWQNLRDSERLRAIAHEYVHVAQLENTGLAIAEQTLAASVGAVPPAGPYWLLEGSAEVVSWLVLQQLDLGTYGAALADYAIESRSDPVTLSDMENYIGYVTAGSPGLARAILATDYLLRHRSLGELFAFWSDIGQGARWQDAFTRRFGMPLQFFYQSFDEYYDALIR